MPPAQRYVGIPGAHCCTTVADVASGQLTRDEFFYLAHQLSEEEAVKLADLLLRWVNSAEKTD
jgi:hypothetical protein